MLWLESVIGTAYWCWWQVPARRFNGASGRLRCDKTRLASTRKGTVAAASIVSQRSSCVVFCASITRYLSF